VSRFETRAARISQGRIVAWEFGEAAMDISTPKCMPAQIIARNLCVKSRRVFHRWLRSDNAEWAARRERQSCGLEQAHAVIKARLDGLNVDLARARVQAEQAERRLAKGKTQSAKLEQTKPGTRKAGIARAHERELFNANAQAGMQTGITRHYTKLERSQILNAFSQIESRLECGCWNGRPDGGGKPWFEMHKARGES
jgi:hypothetical protein